MFHAVVVRFKRVCFASPVFRYACSLTFLCKRSRIVFVQPTSVSILGIQQISC